jgi:malate/lactate dehydrogenase
MHRRAGACTTASPKPLPTQANAFLVPTRVGRAGVIEHLQIHLWPKESQSLRPNGAAVYKVLDTVLARIG